MSPKITDIEASTIDYRLNHLGIRVSQEKYQLIAMTDGEWMPFGVPRNIPMEGHWTRDAAVINDPLNVTAVQYQAAHPQSDLADVLSQNKAFLEALNERQIQSREVQTQDS